MRKKAASSIVVLSFALGLGSHAWAQDEFHSIVLDKTGSMTLDGIDGDRWDDAINHAQMVVNDDGITGLNVQHAFSIWTFRRTGTEADLKRVWPLSAADCTNLPSGTGALIGDPTIGAGADEDGLAFCVLADSLPNGSADDISAVSDELETIRSDRAEVGPSTPLGNSLCESLQRLRDFASGSQMVITLESDGDENASLDTINPCVGLTGTVPADFELNLDPVANLPDFGLDSDGWEAKVVRRASRVLVANLNNAVATPVFAATDLWPGPNLRWNVGVHFELFPETSLLAVTSSGPMPLALLLASPTEGIAPPQPLQLLTDGSSMTMTAAAAVPSIDPGELSFFRILGTSTPDSTFETIVRDPTVAHGVDHAIAGDVDDSGCADIADYNIIMQEDVWQKRAVPPLEIAIRADLNRDSFINWRDVDVLFDDWGTGCVNSAGEPPHPDTCFDGVRNVTETDVDCGGVCPECTVGALCGDGTDCDSSSCVDGLCEAPTCEDGVQNGDELDVDCGGTACEPCEGDLGAEVVVTTDWGAGYCANIAVTNHTTDPTTSWAVTIDTNMSQIFTNWSATFSGDSGSVNVTPFSWNSVIAPSATNTSVGFCANRTGSGGEVATVTASSATF